MTALYDEAELLIWADCLQFDGPGYAKEVLREIRRVDNKLGSKSEAEITIWRIGQKEEISKLTEAQKAKVRGWLGTGRATAFGAALELSEARHSAWLWRLIAERAGNDSELTVGIRTLP